MIKLKELYRTCYACPSQWEGLTEDDKYFYARYRHGYFYAEVEGERIFETSYGEELDGLMSDSRMFKLLDIEEIPVVEE